MNYALDLALSKFYTIDIHFSSAQCQRQDCHRNCNRSGLFMVITLPLAFLFMISLQTFKKALGKRWQYISDDEVEQLRDLQYKYANILFDIWSHEHRKQKSTTEVIEYQKDGNCIVMNLAYVIA